MNYKKQKELYYKLADKLNLPPNASISVLFEKMRQTTEKLNIENEDDQQDAKEIIELVNEIMAPVVSQMYELLQLIDGLSEEELKDLEEKAKQIELEEERKHQEEREQVELEKHEPNEPLKTTSATIDMLSRLYTSTPQRIEEKSNAQRKPTYNKMMTREEGFRLRADFGNKYVDAKFISNNVLINDVQHKHLYKQLMDRIGHMICYSREQNKKPFYTLTEICRAYYGKEYEQIKQEDKLFIAELLEELSMTKVVIDLQNDDIQDENGQQILKMTGNCLNYVTMDKLTPNGEVVKEYCFTQLPIMYRFSLFKNGVAPIPSYLLNTGNSKLPNRTKEILNNLLVERIIQMKRTPKLSRTILFDTLVKDAGMEKTYDLTNRTQKKRLKDFIVERLEYFEKGLKDEDAYIKGYALHKKGQSILGVKIFLYEDERKKKRTKK